MALLLSAEGLEKRFGGVVAARDVTVAVDAGETVGVIGANGAGKTTFVNMVTGYLTPSAGRILFDGRDITGFDPRRTARAGVRRSFQIAQVFGDLTALENMAIAAIVAEEGQPSPFRRSLSPARLEAARTGLARFGLEDRAGQRAGTLPQGAKKQLDIAMAAVGSPRLMLLDEPTSGVSADEKIAMMDTVIAPLRREGATILFIEHDMDIVARYAERVVAFYEGTVLADGPVAEVLDDPRVREHVIGEATQAEARGAAPAGAGGTARA